MRILLAGLAFGLGFLPLVAMAQTAMPIIRHMQVQPANAQPMQNSNPSAGGCPMKYQSGGLCWDASPIFKSYLAASTQCAAEGGRLPTLGELSAFRGRWGATETGIECSSNFDMGSATLWCVGDGGAVSGTTYNQQTDPLEKLPAEFRCVTYLKS